MFQITNQPQDITVNKNETFTLSTTVSGGSVSDSFDTIYDGSTFNNRTFIVKGNGNVIYSGAYNTTNNDYQVIKSTNGGYTWGNITVNPPVELYGRYPTCGALMADGGLIWGTNKPQGFFSWIVENNSVVFDDINADVLGIFTNDINGFKAFGFAGNLSTLSNGRFIYGSTTGHWDVSVIATNLTPYSWVKIAGGFLYTLASGFPDNTGVGVFYSNVKSATKKLNIGIRTCLARVTDTKIIAVNFDKNPDNTYTISEAKYTTNNGTTWSTYTNIPPIASPWFSRAYYDNGWAYIPSMDEDRIIYRSYNDGAWEAFEITDLATGTNPQCYTNIPGNSLLFSSQDGTGGVGAKILKLNKNIMYNYELFKSPSTTPMLSVSTIDTDYTYTRPNAILSDSGDYYYKITNNSVTLTSDTATVLVVDPFRIVDQPYAQTVTEGRAFSVVCNVEGGDVNAGYTFKVYKDNVLISTQFQMSGTYSYGRAISVLSDSGTYRVEVTNVSTTLISNNAIITIVAKGPDRPTWTFNNSNIIDRSITDFKNTPIDKCYNDFNISFHKYINDYLGQIIITNVDKDSFPEYSPEGIQYLTAVDIAETYTYMGTYSNVTRYYYAKLSIANDAALIADINANLGLWWKWNVTYFNNPHTIEAYGVEIHTTTDEYVTYKFFKAGGTIPASDSDVVFYLDSVQKQNTATVDSDWRTYVIGISDYTTAKDLWDKAHNSYILNKRIRKLPSDRGTLQYCIETNFIDGPKTNKTLPYPQGSLDTDEYALSYTNLLLDYTTKQKFTVSFQVPITKDLIKMELCDKVIFTDPIITPLENEYGKGRITNIQVNPAKGTITVGVLFDTLFFVAQSAIRMCGDIIETGYNVDNVIETGDNVDEILEGTCPNI